MKCQPGKTQDMQRQNIENAVVALAVLALLVSVVHIYRANLTNHPPDIQNDVMMKSSPAANPPPSIAP